MAETKKIYLDHHATTPVDPRVLKEMLPYFTEIYGNAASIDHDFGYEAKQAVDKAREQIAKVINAHADEIIFTSGATESNNIALFGVAEKYAKKGQHIITCTTEHKAILDCCAALEKRGYRITYLPVDEFGVVDLGALKDAIASDTILISIMAANNEIGTIAPLKEIGKIAREHGVLFHSDGAQAVGHIPLDVQDMNIDILSMSAHKIYGPKGVGALYRRRSNPRVNLSPVIYGGGHEKGLRSGTLNVPGIVGFGKAVEIAGKEMKQATHKYREWTDWMWSEFQKNFEDVQLNGHPTNRLSHNLNISIPGVESKALIVQLKDIAISTGSACTTNVVEPSHVIAALVDETENRPYNSIRVGIGRFNTDEEIRSSCHKLIEKIREVKLLMI